MSGFHFQHPDFARRKAVITEMWKDWNITAGDIGAQLGMTKSAVLGMIHRLGLPARPRGYAPKRVRQAGARKAALTRIARGTNNPPPSNGGAALKPTAQPRQRPGAGIAVVSTLNPGASCCHFPLWGKDLPPRDQQFFCGRPGHPWCAEHRAVVFNPIRAEAA